VLQARVITLFPDLVTTALSTSILGRARETGGVDIEVTDLRTFGIGRYRRVDDSPYGGGPGMVFRPEPVFEAVEDVCRRVDGPCRLLLPSPQGRLFDQAFAAELAAEPRAVVILCGHYEGVDERILIGLDFEEVSVGNFVLTGGELAALVMLDAAVRLIPGVLGNADSPASDSFSERLDGQLKYPQYTRPAAFRGMEVPEVLRSGHHAEIERWRRAQSRAVTGHKRPELLESTPPHGAARDAADPDGGEI